MRFPRARCGPPNSPAFGRGTGAHLADVGIGVVADLPGWGLNLLRLSSSDPAARPIDPSHYHDPRDVDVVTAGPKIARELGRSKAYAPMNHTAGIREYLWRS